MDDMTSNVLFGTHIHPASGDAARRQILAMAVLRDLCPLTPVNLPGDRDEVQVHTDPLAVATCRNAPAYPVRAISSAATRRP